MAQDDQTAAVAKRFSLQPLETIFECVYCVRVCRDDLRCFILKVHLHVEPKSEQRTST